MEKVLRVRWHFWGHNVSIRRPGKTYEPSDLFYWVKKSAPIIVNTFSFLVIDSFEKASECALGILATVILDNAFVPALSYVVGQTIHRINGTVSVDRKWSVLLWAKVKEVESCTERLSTRTRTSVCCSPSQRPALLIYTIHIHWWMNLTVGSTI